MGVAGSSNMVYVGVLQWCLKRIPYSVTMIRRSKEADSANILASSMVCYTFCPWESHQVLAMIT